MEIHKWLGDRQIGSNKEPFELTLVDDTDLQALDLTGYAGTFELVRVDGAAGGFSGVLQTLGTDGRCVYQATKAQVDALTEGEWGGQWVVTDGAGQVVHKTFIYGYRFRSNVS